MGTSIDFFISVFGSENPTLESLKSKVSMGQWHDIFDNWKEKGILN